VFCALVREDTRNDRREEGGEAVIDPTCKACWPNDCVHGVGSPSADDVKVAALEAEIAALREQHSEVRRERDEIRCQYVSADAYLRAVDFVLDKSVPLVDFEVTRSDRVRLLAAQNAALLATRTFWPMALRQAIARGDVEACKAWAAKDEAEDEEPADEMRELQKAALSRGQP